MKSEANYQDAQNVANETIANLTNANQTSGGVVSNKPIKAETKRKRNTSPFWDTLKNAKRVFSYQMVKSNDLKLKCVERFLGMDTPDIEKFWLNYRDYADKLLDSKRFEAQCKVRELNPVIVAEHIVFLGSADFNKVLMNGIDWLGHEVSLYKEPFTADKVRSTHQID